MDGLCIDASIAIRPETMAPVGLEESDFLAAARRAHVQLRSCVLRYADCAADDDLIQETLSMAWQHRAAFAGRGPAEGWLYRICQRTCRIWLRSQSRTPSTDQYAAECAASSEAMTSAAEERDVLDDERISMVLALPKQRRAVTLLRYIEGMTTEEIATHFGVSPGTVRATLFTARQQLRRQDQARHAGAASSDDEPR